MTAKQFCETWGIIARSKPVDRNPAMPTWTDANHYRVTLTMRHGDRISKFTTYFSKGFGHTTAPSAAEVIQCLKMDIVGYGNTENFEDWCADYGYDPDSKKAEKIYYTIADQAEKMAGFLYYPNARKQFEGISEE